jgi:HEPN domain.
MSEDQKDHLDLLGSLNIEARYPTDKQKILNDMTVDKCRNILNRTEALYKWIKAQL